MDINKRQRLECFWTYCFVIIAVLLWSVNAPCQGTGQNWHGDSLTYTPFTYGNLGPPVNGRTKYCSDCNANTNPCQAGGTGAWVVGLGSNWVCQTGGVSPSPITVFFGARNPEQCGAKHDDVTDDTAAINECDDMTHTAGGAVMFPPGKYLVLGTVHVDSGTNWEALGSLGTTGLFDLSQCTVTLDLKGSGQIIGTSPWVHQYFRGICIDNSGSSGTGMNSMDAQYGASSSEFDNLGFRTKGSVGSSGLIIRGHNPVTNAANNNQYNNNIRNIRCESVDTEASDSCVKMWGTNNNNERSNGNMIENVVGDGYLNGVWLNGNGNWIVSTKVNETHTGGSCITIEGDTQTTGNYIMSPYCESAAGYKIVLIQDSTNKTNMASIYSGLDVLTPLDVAINNQNARYDLFTPNSSYQSGNTTGTDVEQNPKFSCIDDTGLCLFQAEPLNGFGGNNIASAKIIESGANYTAVGNGIGINGSMASEVNTNGDYRVNSHATGSPGTYVRLETIDGTTGNLTLHKGDLFLNKNANALTAPGASSCQLKIQAGTTGGSCKLVMTCGTSSSATTVIDNVGSGC